MRLTKLRIASLLGVRQVHLSLPYPLTIVCGPNWSGKSSIQNALRLVLTGEVPRVERRGWRELIRDGAEKGVVSVEWDEDTLTAEVGREVTVPPEAVIHPALLDQHRLSRLKPEDLRKELLSIFGGEFTPADVRKRLAQEGADLTKADLVLPLIAAGFETVLREVEKRTSECRGHWKATTGEQYGPVKGEEWKASAESIKASAQAHAPHLEERRQAFEEARQRLEEWTDKVAAMRSELAGAGAVWTCQECGAVQAKVALERVEELRLLLPPAETKLHELQGEVEMLRKRALLSEQALVEIGRAESTAAERTTRAYAIHKDVLAWLKLGELFSPAGIPSKLVEQQLEPLNRRLAQSSSVIGLGQVTVSLDMTIRKDGRLYALLSEAEQWLVDAMLVEAIGHVQDVGFLMLDRLDVLDLPKRSAVLSWLKRLAQEGTQVLAFATLKKRPVIEGALTLWLEGGEVKEGAFDV